MPNNYVLLETIALTQSAASVTFDNLPTSGYTDLKIVASTRTDYAGFLDLNMFFNGNASSGYSWRRLNGDGGSATSTNSTSAGVIPSATLGTTSTANTFANTEIYIPNYRSSVSKSVSIDAVTENNATTSYQTFTAGLSTLSTPITSVSFGLGAGNFVAGSTFSLYGVAAFGTTPALAPKATGGNIVANDGTYWYHAFTSSGNFVPQTSLTCDVLQVGGGGGGGSNRGGGGGAGGLYALSAQALNSAQNYSVVVGAGGAGMGGSSGTQSQFGSLTSASGGGRGGNSQAAGVAGGSGGGGGNELQSNPTPAGGAGNTPSRTPSQGNNGGTCNTGDKIGSGGGGGGYSAAGGNGSGQTGGAGGSGTNAYSSWASATSTGVSGFYAGGGGGYGAAGVGSGGAGGGGNGASGNNNNGTSGASSTGGGGGASSDTGTSYNGGSGIVIVRYAIN